MNTTDSMPTIESIPDIWAVLERYEGVWCIYRSFDKREAQRKLAELIMLNRSRVDFHGYMLVRICSPEGN